MVRLITTKGCGNCKIVEARLKRTGKDYKYQLIDSLPPEEQMELKEKAKEAGQRSFPIILDKEQKVITIEKAIKGEDN